MILPHHRQYETKSKRGIDKNLLNIRMTRACPFMLRPISQFRLLTPCSILLLCNFTPIKT